MRLSYEMTGSGKYMVVDLNSGEKVNKFVYGMLANNDLPGIISPQLADTEGDETEIMYNLGNMVSISILEALGSNVYMIDSVCEQLVELWSLLDEYMLSDRYFVWNKECMYMDPGTGRIGIVCICVDQEGARPLERERFLDYLMGKTGNYRLYLEKQQADEDSSNENKTDEKADRKKERRAARKQRKLEKQAEKTRRGEEAGHGKETGKTPYKIPLAINAQ